MNTLTLEGCSKIQALGHCSNHISRGLEHPKYLSYEADIFLPNSRNFVQIAIIIIKISENVVGF